MNEISQKQLEANRQNAQLGGVKTEEGKSISKLNALKHGLLTKEILLEGEDAESLEELSQNLRADLKPEGEMENILVEKIISSVWRLKRALRIEKAKMEIKSAEALQFPSFASGNDENKRRISEFYNEDVEKLLRYESALERGLYKALHELQRLQAARAGEKPATPIAIDMDISQDP